MLWVMRSIIEQMPLDRETPLLASRIEGR